LISVLGKREVRLGTRQFLYLTFLIPLPPFTRKLAMDLSKLSVAELRLVAGALEGLLLDHPQMKNISSLSKEIWDRLKDNPDSKEGERLREIAERHGLEDGYAAPEDYYFFVKEEDIEGEKHIELLLCLKCQWYLDGKAYDHNKSMQCRNFHDFYPGKYYDGYEFVCKPAELRAALLKAGLEEKPELEGFYDELCKAGKQ
jgi:hypothetical protein